MSEATFAEARQQCGLTATTYIYRDGFFLDEPLVDFSRERDPDGAHNCFNKALEAADREATERGATHISYIWEWRTAVE